MSQNTVRPFRVIGEKVLKRLSFTVCLLVLCGHSLAAVGSHGGAKDIAGHGSWSETREDQSRDFVLAKERGAVPLAELSGEAGSGPPATGEDPRTTYSAIGYVASQPASGFLGSLLELLYSVDPNYKHNSLEADTIMNFVVGDEVIDGSRIAALPEARIGTATRQRVEMTPLLRDRCNLRSTREGPVKPYVITVLDTQHATNELITKCMTFPFMLRRGVDEANLADLSLREMVAGLFFEPGYDAPQDVGVYRTDFPNDAPFSTGGELMDEAAFVFHFALTTLLEFADPSFTKDYSSVNDSVLYAIGDNAIIDGRINPATIRGVTPGLLKTMQEKELDPNGCNMHVLRTDTEQTLYWTVADTSFISESEAQYCVLAPFLAKKYGTPVEIGSTPLKRALWELFRE
ncbi:hypothetical protein ACFORG_09140 [Lutimaribacter marinistellae]|uniref:Uncharacterized protein n=1 Tax=Lutimaribacter marinistellae TaxID=1820329 RepID=A0ABV7TEA0_9RHOB